MLTKAPLSPNITVQVLKTRVPGNIGQAVGHTWLSVLSDLTIDVYNNSQQLIPATSAIRVGPQIAHWSLDMNAAKVSDKLADAPVNTKP